MYLTTYSKLKEYKNESSEIIQQLENRIKFAALRVKRLDKNVYDTLIYYHNDRPFVCAINATPVLACCIVYKILPTKNSFEATAYDPRYQKYYFFRDHFFERYARRMHLMHKTPQEIVCHFVKSNSVIVYDRDIRKPGSKKEFKAVINSGYVFCNQKDGNHIINFDSLIDNYTLLEK